MRQLQSAFRRAHDTEPNSSVVKCLSNHTLSTAELQNVTTLQYPHCSEQSYRTATKRQLKAPEEACPQSPTVIGCRISQSSIRFMTKENDDKGVKLVLMMQV